MKGSVLGVAGCVVQVDVHASELCFGWATVKAGTQERGTEVMWFHTGNYTEMVQEATINGIAFPAATSCNSTAILRI